jgi:hypothetical protein
MTQIKLTLFLVKRAGRMDCAAVNRHQPNDTMKTTKTTKTITIDGTRYTAARLRKLAKTGSEFIGNDICVEVPGGEIALREYPNDREIAVLNYGLAQRKDQPFCIALAFLA